MKRKTSMHYCIAYPVSLSDWKRIQMGNGYKKFSFVTQDVFAAEFKNAYSHEYSVLVKHKYLITNQYAVVEENNDNLNVETCTVQMDFAERSVKKSSPLTSKTTLSHCSQLWCIKRGTFRMKTMRNI